MVVDKFKIRLIFIRPHFNQLHCVPKNVTTLSRYNSDIHKSISTIFGTNVTKKVGNQKVHYFPISPNSCSCTT